VFKLLSFANIKRAESSSFCMVYQIPFQKMTDGSFGSRFKSASKAKPAAASSRRMMCDCAIPYKA